MKFTGMNKHKSPLHSEDIRDRGNNKYLDTLIDICINNDIKLSIITDQRKIYEGIKFVHKDLKRIFNKFQRIYNFDSPKLGFYNLGLTCINTYE